MQITKLTLALALAAVSLAAPVRAEDPVFVVQLDGRAEARHAEDREEASEVRYLDPWTLKGERNFNLVVEIPTGTSQKWETCTSSSLADPVAFPRCDEARPGRLMVQEVKKGARRVVSYLGYPGNYGSLPRTKGADGDPLDIIAIGPGLERGSVVPVKVVGVIRCDDGGDQDDKVLALTLDSPLFAKVNSLADMDAQAVSGAELVRAWFDNYKGAKPGSGMNCPLVEDELVARKVIAAAQAAFTTP
jgi:inorganic pyrophosphatase